MLKRVCEEFRRTLGKTIQSVHLLIINKLITGLSNLPRGTCVCGGDTMLFQHVNHGQLSERERERMFMILELMIKCAAHEERADRAFELFDHPLLTR